MIRGSGRLRPEVRAAHAWRARARRWWPFVAGVLLLAALALPLIGPALVVSAPVASPDVIVSLASHEWERLPEVARAAQTYRAATVVLTIPDEVTPYNCHECGTRVDTLAQLGVPADRIRELKLSQPGTFGEARALRQFAEAHHIRRLLVITSPYHTRRALAVFRAVFDGTGVEVGIGAASRTSPARPSRWLLASYDRAYVAYEVAALVYYAFKYGVWAW